MLGQVILGKYKITRLLDEGGMSKVYLARNERSDPARDVVVKVLKEQLRLQSKTVEHFRREIHISSRFQHPHAVTCIDWSTRGPGGPVLVMEYLRGVDLGALLAREVRFTPERTGRLLVQLCDVLQSAHDQGIVHRDLKPGNLMILHPGTPLEMVKLMDFGLAKMTSMLYISPEELVDFSLPAASGTPEYISPEMVRGNELDARADLYSVGVILFELLAGRRPFKHASTQALMLAHADRPPPRFADVGVTDVPPGIETLVRCCLAKYPEERPKSAWELALAYEKALGRRLITGRAPVGAGPASGGAGASGAFPIPVRSKALATPAPALDTTPLPERNAIRHTVETTMPEVMALIKLKGFIGDLGGEVVESVPGLIRVRLAEPRVEKKGGLFGWGGARTSSALQAPQATDLELHMERKDQNQPNRLTITLVLRRAGGGLITPDWRERCNRIGRDLQAYLMGR
jgi:serine/threonine-protein kinase